MARKRALKTSRNNVFHLQEALLANGQAVSEGPKRKTWSSHDLADIKPLTYNQQAMFRDFIEGRCIVAHGTAGTGKTFAAIFLAMNEILRVGAECDKLVIVRSAVPTREQGFVPGTLEEKAAIYEAPYGPMFQKLFGRTNTYKDMKEAGLVQFETTSFNRGVTWDNVIVVVDECQNMTFHELNTLMTRLGNYSRIIFCGDVPQKDLNKRGDETGMPKFLQVAERMDSFSIIKFNKHDIVRGPLVKEWIEACEEVGV